MVTPMRGRRSIRAARRRWFIDASGAVPARVNNAAADRGLPSRCTASASSPASAASYRCATSSALLRVFSWAGPGRRGSVRTLERSALWSAGRRSWLPLPEGGQEFLHRVDEPAPLSAQQGHVPAAIGSDGVVLAGSGSPLGLPGRNDVT